ncbi:DsrE family protein [candidate division WOR-3 bacterium]|nr:DsrE family protein [candidate division WOR-3 bacterium]
MTVTIILNDPPYGTERTYNGLRLALQLKKSEGNRVRVFLMQDAVFAALKEQDTPTGYYNIGRMLAGVGRAGEVRACVTCMSARGLKEEQLIEGVTAGDMALAAEWVESSDRVVSF